MPNNERMNGWGRGTGLGWGQGGQGGGRRGGRGGRMAGGRAGTCRRLGTDDPAGLAEALQMERDMLKQRLATVEAMLAENTADTPPARTE